MLLLTYIRYDKFEKETDVSRTRNLVLFRLVLLPFFAPFLLSLPSTPLYFTFRARICSSWKVINFFFFFYSDSCQFLTRSRNETKVFFPPDPLFLGLSLVPFSGSLSVRLNPKKKLTSSHLSFSKSVQKPLKVAFT